jgi:hypothetical protein
MTAIAIVLALAQAPTGIVQPVFEMSGQVDRIDRAGRTITIRSAGVVQTPIYAGPDMPVFDTLASGDTVTIRYYDAYIVAVTPGERLKPLENTTAEATEKLNRPDAAVIEQTRLVVTIDAVDAATGMVTYHGFDNRRVLRAVQRRELLEGIRVGDVVTITHTRARAVGITKAQ